jgi:hypothetical protein
MKKLKVQSDQLIIQLLDCNWMAESDLATRLGCRRHQVYDKVLQIASEHRLLSMRVEIADDAFVILFPRSKTGQILDFMSRLPRPGLLSF